MLQENKMKKKLENYLKDFKIQFKNWKLTVYKWTFKK